MQPLLKHQNSPDHMGQIRLAGGMRPPGRDNGCRIKITIRPHGYKMLLEMERIVLDPTQPVAARIMAAWSAPIEWSSLNVSA